MSAPEARVVVGRIARAHGIRGEVVLESLSDQESRFDAGSVFTLARSPEEEGRPVTVVSRRTHKGRPLVKLDGIDDRTHAEQRVGFYLLIPEADAVASLEEGEFFFHDLVGSTVRDDAGRQIGTVRAAIESDGPVLLEIDIADGGRRFLPFVDAFVESVEDRVITVTPPEGWEDL